MIFKINAKRTQNLTSINQTLLAFYIYKINFYYHVKSICLMILFLIYLIERFDCFLDKSFKIIMNKSILLITRFKIIYN